MLMPRFTRITTVLGVLIALSLCGALPAAAQTSVQVTASWNPPTEGSPVVHYVLQLSIDGGNFTTVATVEGVSHVLELEIDRTYIARVAGVDAQDRQGPWSLPSDPYTPDVGAPGQPGKPMIL
jgi:hypothetical protein